MNFRFRFLVPAILVFVTLGYLMGKDQPWTRWPKSPTPHHITRFGGCFPVLEGPNAEQVATTFLLLGANGQRNGSFTVPVGVLVPDATLPSYTLKFVPNVRTNQDHFGGKVYFNVLPHSDGQRDIDHGGGGIIAS